MFHLAAERLIGMNVSPCSKKIERNERFTLQQKTTRIGMNVSPYSKRLH